MVPVRPEPCGQAPVAHVLVSLLGFLLQDPLQHGILSILEFCPRRNDLLIRPNQVLALVDKIVKPDRIAKREM
jgi:hypothetical protein